MDTMVFNLRHARRIHNRLTHERNIQTHHPQTTSEKTWYRSTTRNHIRSASQGHILHESWETVTYAVHRGKFTQCTYSSMVYLDNLDADDMFVVFSQQYFSFPYTPPSPSALFSSSSPHSPSSSLVHRTPSQSPNPDLHLSLLASASFLPQPQHSLSTNTCTSPSTTKPWQKASWALHQNIVYTLP